VNEIARPQHKEILREHWLFEVWFPSFGLLKVKQNRSKCPHWVSTHALRQEVHFLPPRLTGAVYHSFPQKVPPQLLQDVDLFSVHTWWYYATFSFCSSGILERNVSGAKDNSVACSLP
jgi:hypothetical protein